MTAGEHKDDTRRTGAIMPERRAGDAVVTRTPVLGASGDLFAYELSGQIGSTAASTRDGSTGTPALLNTVLNVIGLHELVGSHDVLVTIGSSVLAAGDHLLLPPNRTILSIADSGRAGGSDMVAAATIAQVRAAREAGYRIAFDAEGDLSGSEEIMANAAIVRTSMDRLGDPRVSRALESARSRGVLVLAGGVDTPEALDRARAARIDLVQGEFFMKPDTRRASPMAGIKALRLQLLAKLGNEEIDLAGIEEAVKCDAALTCSLLRYLNSPALGVRHRISSVKQALVMLGERPLRRWLTVACLGAMAESKPSELLVTAVARSRFCENLGSALTPSGQDPSWHLLGLLSVIDALLDQPMEQAIDALPVDERIRTALVGATENDLASALALVQACERGAWATVTRLLPRFQLTQREAAARYYDALSWTTQALDRAA